MPNQQRKAEPKLIYKTLLVFRMPAFENRKIFRRTGVRTALFSLTVSQISVSVPSRAAWATR